MSVEVWKDVKGYEGLYQVSSLGRIKSFEKCVNRGKCHRGWKEHLLAFGIDGSGYFRTNLANLGKNRTVKVHRIVAETFLDNPDNLPQVNHKDGDKQNNHVDNLEWCDASHNIRHAFEHGLNRKPKGELNPAAKLSQSDVNFIRENYTPRHPEFGTVALGKRFGVHRKTISRITTGQYWKEGDVNETISASN